MGVLSHEEILVLHAAIVSARLSSSRSALLAGVDQAFIASLPHAAAPGEQVLTDVDAINAAGTLVNGTIPLLVWLANAVALSGSRAEVAVFEAARGRVRRTSEALQQVDAEPFDSDSKPAPPRLKSAVRVALIRQYAHERWDPSDLPDAFWDEPECPPFIPPVGVFKEWMGEIYLKDGQPYGRWMGQSSGWMPEVSGPPSYLEETQREAIIPGWFDDRLPPGFADNNLNYEIAKQAWESEWKRRRR